MQRLYMSHVPITSLSLHGPGGPPNHPYEVHLMLQLLARLALHLLDLVDHLSRLLNALPDNLALPIKT